MISVVMPTYNASKFVAEAIESVLNQTFTDFELIVVDDGSTDNTLEIVQRYAQQDSRIRVIQAEHGGPSRARNLAIEASQYPWIAILDADDIALPHRFATQIEAATKNPHVVAWGAAVHHINAEGTVLSISRLGPTTEAAFYQMRKDGHVVNLNHPTALMRKDIVLKVGGYNPDFLAAQDLEMLDRMAAYGPILATPEALTLYRVHSNSISMQRFFLQRQSMRYVRARHLARLAGKPEPTFEEFLAERRQRSPLVRLSKHLLTMGMFYYRKAGLLVGEKQYAPAVFYLGLAAAVNPSYVLPRVWEQVLSPKTRKLLKRSDSTRANAPDTLAENITESEV